jgi:glucokinase
MKNIIGIDVGGTNIAGGKVVNGKVISYANAPTPKTRKKFISALFEVIASLKDKNTKAVGIGFPAPIVNGVIHEVHNIPSLNNTNMKRVVEKKFRIKCVVDNDANAFALAETKFGAAKGKKHVVGITLGTGVGCGIIINGKIYSGNTGAAGEISRIPVDGTKLEEFANIRFLKKISGKSGKELYELAKKGNRKALKTWKTYGKNVGEVLAVVIDVLDPEVIVLGGNLAGAYPFFKSQLMPEIRKYAFKYTASKVKVVQSKIIKDSAVLGAAALC